MEVIYQLNDKHIHQLYGLYKQAWWAKDRTLDDTRKCILGSQVCIGLVNDSNDLIAFARIITDFVFKAIIFDVIVCPTNRGLGLGKKLMGIIENHDDLKTVNHIELYCLPEMNSFYESLGYSSCLGGISLMRRTREN